MPRVKINYIVSFSSEDPDHPAANLLQESATGKRWLAAAGSGTASVVLQLSRAIKFSSLSIGAHHTALVEVLVGRAESPQYEVLVPRCILQSPTDARRGLNPDRVRSFNAEQMTEGVRENSWDRVRVVCSQPYDKHCKFGLSFVHIFEPEDSRPPPRTLQLSVESLRRASSEDEGLRPGALFEAHVLNASGSENQTSGSQIRQATSRALKNIPDSCTKLVKTPLSKEKARCKPPENVQGRISSKKETRDKKKEREDENEEISKNVQSRNERNSNFDNAKAEATPKEDVSSAKKSEKKDRESCKRERDKKSSRGERNEGRKRTHDEVSKQTEEYDTDDEIEKFLRKQKKKQDGDTRKSIPNEAPHDSFVTKECDHKRKDNITHQCQEETESHQAPVGVNQDLKKANQSARVLPMFLDGLAFSLDDSVSKSGFDEQLVRRYVLAYGGEIVEDTEAANYLLCGSEPAHAHAAPLRADWLWRCHRTQRRARLDPYLLT